MRYRLDPGARRLADGRSLLGGSPLKLLRLTAAGVGWLDRVEAGEDVAPNTLLDRLVDGGALHPMPAIGDATLTTSDVTVVIPTRRGDVAGLVAALTGRRRAAATDAGEPPGAAGSAAGVIVVDDASPVPIGPIHGALVVRRDRRGGPAGARMTGLDLVTTELVAFVDDDVEVTDDWLEVLLAHFVDPRIALVAPRVASAAPTATGQPRTMREAIAAYEAVRSPLDLGPSTASVRAGTRVSYVPSAAIVCRVGALRALGGFDLTLRTGEDVDLVWRLDRAGWRCRYEPAAVVVHRPRTTVRGLVGQRVAYGRSAAPLAIRHPGALAPVRVSGWSAAVWALAVCGEPALAAGVAGGTIVALAKKVPALPLIEAARLAGLGHLFAGRQLASALTRAWWPITLAAALVSRRARRFIVMAILVPAALDRRQTRPQLDAGRYLAMRMLDDAAYGVGLWQGAWQERTMQPLAPDFTSWPRASKVERSAPMHRRPAGG